MDCQNVFCLCFEMYVLLKAANSYKWCIYTDSDTSTSRRTPKNHIVIALDCQSCSDSRSSKTCDMKRDSQHESFTRWKDSVELGDMCLILENCWIFPFLRFRRDARKLLGKTRQNQRPFSQGDLCHKIHHLLASCLTILAWIILTICRLILAWSSKEGRKEGREGKGKEEKGKGRKGRKEGKEGRKEEEGKGRKERDQPQTRIK